MPKELIYDGNNRRPGENPDSGNLTPKAVEVDWGHNSTVEIASINLEEEPYTEKRGWFVYLDRININRLIQVLRKARDQAYGVDE